MATTTEGLKIIGVIILTILIDMMHMGRRISTLLALAASLQP